ncbi:fatty acid desaturase [Streptacidiphilus sp. EB129]|uniref:fatty acid desaturase family protein n=1 Tax=Streptacidiphilus sp. EB129 TaxID=3156262 RepID=UPI003516F4D7
MTIDQLQPPRPLLFRRVAVTPSDQRAFLLRLALAAALGLLGGYLALRPDWYWTAAGWLLLGAVYTHAVELQHQCLHHSAFLRPGAHRPVGFLLGLPLLVCFSHYRIRHLQHHRYLGTPQDGEFFGFDTRRGLTPTALLSGLFDYRRLLLVLPLTVRAWRPGAGPDFGLGQTSERMRRAVTVEYRLTGAVLLLVPVALVLGGGRELLDLWAGPLLVAVPMHFLVELPEHVLCDTESTDVLRNTRSISGSRLSTWFTNGNNLHVEHHAAMTVPINRLRERHDEVRRTAVHVEASYAAFFRLVLRTSLRRDG